MENSISSIDEHLELSFIYLQKIKPKLYYSVDSGMVECHNLEYRRIKTLLLAS